MEQADVRPRLEVATAVFEGPLELLLALAEREELDILEVSLAGLTNSYVSAVAALKRPDPRRRGDPGVRRPARGGGDFCGFARTAEARPGSGCAAGAVRPDQSRGEARALSE